MIVAFFCWMAVPFALSASVLQFVNVRVNVPGGCFTGAVQLSGLPELVVLAMYGILAMAFCVVVHLLHKSKIVLASLVYLKFWATRNHVFVLAGLARAILLWSSWDSSKYIRTFELFLYVACFSVTDFIFLLDHVSPWLYNSFRMVFTSFLCLASTAYVVRQLSTNSCNMVLTHLSAPQQVFLRAARFVDIVFIVQLAKLFLMKIRQPHRPTVSFKRWFINATRAAPTPAVVPQQQGPEQPPPPPQQRPAASSSSAPGAQGPEVSQRSSVSGIGPEAQALLPITGQAPPSLRRYSSSSIHSLISTLTTASFATKFPRRSLLLHRDRAAVVYGVGDDTISSRLPSISSRASPWEIERDKTTVVDLGRDLEGVMPGDPFRRRALHYISVTLLWALMWGVSGLALTIAGMIVGSISLDKERECFRFSETKHYFTLVFTQGACLGLLAIHLLVVVLRRGYLKTFAVFLFHWITRGNPVAVFLIAPLWLIIRAVQEPSVFGVLTDLPVAVLFGPALALQDFADIILPMSYRINLPTSAMMLCVSLEYLALHVRRIGRFSNCDPVSSRRPHTYTQIISTAVVVFANALFTIKLLSLFFYKGMSPQEPVVSYGSKNRVINGISKFAASQGETENDRRSQYSPETPRGPRTTRTFLPE